MNVYPKVGAKVWVIVKTETRPRVVQVTVTRTDRSTGEVVFRLMTPGPEVTIKRKPGDFWNTEEEARDALWKLHRPWKRVGGVQQNLFMKGEGRG